MIVFFKIVLETLGQYYCILLTEANLKRLRDINEEIQKLRMVNSQRGSREVLYDVVFHYVMLGFVT